MFDPKFISDYRILNIINECTLLIQSPDGKTRKININGAKPVSAISAADNALQDFKQSMLRKRTYSPLQPLQLIHVSMRQTSNRNSSTDLNTTIIPKQKVILILTHINSLSLSQIVPSLSHPCFDKLNY